jgi:hypothetical protein
MFMSAAGTSGVFTPMRLASSRDVWRRLSGAWDGRAHERGAGDDARDEERRRPGSALDCKQ